MKISCLKKLSILCAVAASSLTAHANTQEIKINRPVNSPVLAVHYSQMRAAVAELSINGKSVATKSLRSGKDSGDIEFAIDFASLADGANTAIVTMYDDAGKMLGSERFTIGTEKDESNEIFVQGIKEEAQVQGTLEIKLGVNKEFKQMYVSFFVDDTWKSLKNYEPYSFVWDTTRYTNGWHELQAWVVDEKNNTYKSKKVRVYVNNPSGRTERPSTAPTTKPEPTTTKPAAKPVAKPTAKPTVPLTLTTTPTEMKNLVGKASGVKHMESKSDPITTSQRSMVPTGMRNITMASAAKKPEVKTKTLPNPIAIAKKPLGLRFPNVGNYKISFNSMPVNFDVQPRVVNGIPLTPFRYLFEYAGGKVSWDNSEKTLHAKGMGKTVSLHIGDLRANVNNKWIMLDMAAFLEQSRTVVPLSFMRDLLEVKVDFDPKTKHVLLTSDKH